MRWLVLLAFAGGCYSPQGTRCEPCSGVDECPGGLACLGGKCRENVNACTGSNDGGLDADPLADARVCFGVQQAPFVELCPVISLESRKDLGGVFNTNTDCTYVEPAAANTQALCVVAAERIDVAATRVVGVRPLVLLARFEIVITATGRLNLAGSASDLEGTNKTAAAANVLACAATHGSNVAAGTGGGGPGATFRGRGGTGAAGDNSLSVGSAPVGAPDLTLRGGCRGGDGGSVGGPQNAGGLGGNSGGAIYLLAPQIKIDGVINASGGGGRASLVALTGGAGGGSGGMILIWTLPGGLTLGPDAQIFALGGGGGPGAGATLAGVPGDDPDGPMLPATVTAGPAGAGAGGGALVPDGAAGTNGSAGGGGGAGGGGVGHIQIVPTTPMSPRIAPPPSPFPA